jgi:type IV secretion system protein VirD4
VAVFDPQHLAEGIPAGLRWSPIRGCEDPLTAMIRATGLAAGTGLSAGGVEGGGFWEGKTRTALQALLHAAALDHRPPAELFRWTLDPRPPPTRWRSSRETRGRRAGGPSRCRR